MANSILDNPEVRKITIPLSLEAYHDLGKKGYIQEGSELLEGVLIEKMPEDPIHSSIVSRIYKYLLKNLPENLTVRQENLISFKDSEPEPDLAIVDSEKTDYSESHPNYSHLIIEVAKSTINLDREKARIYSNANIPEYWIINLNNLEIEVYLQPSESGYRFKKILTKEETISPKILQAWKFRLGDYF